MKTQAFNNNYPTIVHFLLGVFFLCEMVIFLLPERGSVVVSKSQGIVTS